MAKFVIECPDCGKYFEARKGIFGTRKIHCPECDIDFDVRRNKLATRECPHCGNTVVFDQSKGSKAKCPVCGEPINTMAETSEMVEFSCKQCGVRIHASKAAATYTCPVCNCENDVAERSVAEKIKHDGMASVIKYEGSADQLVWKHPIEDFNIGSQLIVHESQEAVFFKNGQALDLFGAGRYTLETQQLPILEKAYKLPTDTEGTFHSEVYYINLTNQLAVKWGTPDKINLIDPQTQAPIAIGARGVLNFRVSDSRKLLLKLVGTTGGLTRQDLEEDSSSHVQNYFRRVVQLSVTTNLAQVIETEKLDILTLDQQRMRLSADILPVIQPYFEEYGLTITEFMIMGIVLPGEGEMGYDSLQTIIKMRQANLTKSRIQTETEIKLEELEAKKRLDIRLQQNEAEVEAAHRSVISQRGENEILQAQYDSQRKVAETTGDVASERMKMQLEMERKQQMAQIEAEEMRLKGYSQKDVLQAEVQKAYAEGLGNMTIGAGGGSGVLGDMLGLGVGMAAAGAVAPQITGMMQGMNLGGNTAAPARVPMPGSSDPAGWECPACGTKNITSKFCPDCGAKKPEPKPADTWTCPACGATGITSKFCPECGAKKPEAPAGWTCPACGKAGITSRFCPECGGPKPVPKPAAWNCPNCGAQGITAKFCPDCGTKRGDQ